MRICLSPFTIRIPEARSPFRLLDDSTYDNVSAKAPDYLRHRVFLVLSKHLPMLYRAKPLGFGFRLFPKNDDHVDEPRVGTPYRLLAECERCPLA